MQCARFIVQQINDNAGFVQAVVLFVTCVVLVWYSYETRRLRKSAERQAQSQGEALLFDALCKVHARFAEARSYGMRGLLHGDFPSLLGAAVEEVLGSEFVFTENGEQRVHVGGVLKRLKENREALRRFNNRLRAPEVLQLRDGTLKTTALGVVEGVLLDFDILAIPAWNGVDSAFRAAIAYKPVLERTAKAILPFVAIQWRLRGTTDPFYKYGYIGLLRRLGIDVEGFTQDQDARSSCARSQQGQP